MKKYLLVFILIVLTISLFGNTITQRVNFSSGQGNQELTFDFYEGGFTLTNVNVKLYSTVTGGSNAADNDSDDDNVEVIIHLGAEFALTDRYDNLFNPNVPRLADTNGQNSWEYITETIWTDYLDAENGDGATFDPTSPDGVSHDGLDVNDTRQSDVHSLVLNSYKGTGAFIFDLDKSQYNTIDTGGSAIQGAYTYVTIGGYVEIIYTDDNPLPVTLSSFTADYSNGKPRLNWTTQTESSNAYWNVYRSISQNFGQAFWLNVDQMIEGAGTVTEPTEYSFTDEYGVEENTTYYYWIECIDNAGDTESIGPVSLFIPEGIVNNGTPASPDDYGLKQNFPNPFNPDTRISFALEEDGPAQITIYNLKGNKIKTIFDGIVEANMVQSAYWDGKDENGKTVATGVYLYRLRTNSTNYTKRMLLMK